MLWMMGLGVGFRALLLFLDAGFWCVLGGGWVIATAWFVYIAP
jgi:hypothetical protein